MAKRILLADDSITIQKVISITFAAEDYELVVTGDGETALKKAREARPDLIIADVAMPGKTGYEVCRAVKEDPALKGVPVLLLAGTFEPLNKDEAMRAGADESIVKPFESQELLDKVRELLSRSESASAAEAPLAASAATQAASPDLDASDIWSAGDFLSAPEEFEEKIEETGSVDLDFLSSGGLFEDDLSKGHDFTQASGFTDLVIGEDELKPEVEAKKADSAPAGFSMPFEVERFDAFKKDDFTSEPKFEPKFEIDSFDTFHVEDKKAEPVETVAPHVPDFPDLQNELIEEPFEVEPIRAEPKPSEPARPFWAEAASFDKPQAQMEQIAEPDFLEIPEEVIEAAEPQPVQLSRAEEILFSSPARPLRETVQEPVRAEVQVSDEDVRKAVERAADRVEERLIADLNMKLRKAEAQVAEAVEKSAARVEERLRADINAKLSRVDSLVAEAARKAAATMEEKLKAELTARLEKSVAIPKEQIEALVARTSKQTIEHIAWEVLPELAERLIKAEITKVKEALVRLR